MNTLFKIDTSRWLLVAFGLFLSVSAQAAYTPTKYIFGCYAETLQDFRSFATRAKDSGATHIVLTAEDLPWARWQYDTPGDPYPAWAISNVGLLKIATPEKLKPFIPQDYANEVLDTLAARCRVLRELGLKAAFTTFEPQMLPEAVYRDYPQWRGPQVDQPLRSRVSRFAPAIDHHEVQALYRESVQLLLRHCPEIEILSLHTNDSGTGISWSEGLYPGPNGNSAVKQKKMYQRYHDFFNTLQRAAADFGGTLEIDAEWGREQYPELFAKHLAAGMALQNHEGPNGTKYKNTVGFLLHYFDPFYPVQGIPDPVRFLTELQAAAQSSAPRLFVLIGDRFNRDLYFDVFDRFQENAPTTRREQLDFLNAIAKNQVGEKNTHHLVEAWLQLAEVFQHRKLYGSGGYWFSIGSVHQRWLTRPFVPYPEKLTPEETDYYRPFLFQARSEQRARALDEIQSTYFFEGLGGMFLHERVLQHLDDYVNAARRSIRQIRKTENSEDWASLLDLRLQAFQCLMENTRNAVVYQYYLDLSKEWNLAHRPMERLWQFNGIPERQRLMETARRELDNTQAIIDLITSSEDPILHLTSTPEEEDIRLLGPDLVEQLKRKMEIMIAHWEEHEQLFVKD